MSQSLPSRRTIAKGIAWSVPAIAVAGVVPAFAASPRPPQPGLNGWVKVGGTCYGRTFDGTGDTIGPDGTPFGMFVWDSANPPDTIVVENPTIVFYLHYSDYTWSRQTGGSTDWSKPARCPGRDGTDANGLPMYAYCSVYSGTYGTPITITYNGVEHTAVPLTGRPNWLASRTTQSRSLTHTWIRREVTINGVVVSCIRKEYSGQLVCDGGSSGAGVSSACADCASKEELDETLAHAKAPTEAEQGPM